MASKTKTRKRKARELVEEYFGKEYQPPTLQELQSLPRTPFNTVLASLDLPKQDTSRKSMLKSVKLQVEKLKKQLLMLEKQIARL